MARRRWSRVLVATGGWWWSSIPSSSTPDGDLFTNLLEAFAYWYLLGLGLPLLVTNASATAAPTMPSSTP
jgi:hypothetical protein